MNTRFPIFLLILVVILSSCALANNTIFDPVEAHTWFHAFVEIVPVIVFSE